MTVRETVDARKSKLTEEDLEELFDGAKEVVVTKGKKSLTFAPGDPELASVALGRSGTLRAPTIKVGTRFRVGYSEEPWQAFFG